MRQVGVCFDGCADAVIERALVQTRRQAQTKYPEETTNLIAQIDAFPLHRFATAEQSANRMDLAALHVNGVEPAGPQHLGDPARVCLVGLVAHRGQRCIDLPRLHANDIKACCT